MKYCHDPPLFPLPLLCLASVLHCHCLDCRLSGGRELADHSILAHCSYTIDIVDQMVGMVYLNRLLTRFPVYIYACSRFSLNPAARLIFLIKIF